MQERRRNGVGDSLAYFSSMTSTAATAAGGVSEPSSGAGAGSAPASTAAGTLLAVPGEAAAAAVTLRPVQWSAVSSSVERATPCQRCSIVIPPRFLRMQRRQDTPTPNSPTYYHANYDCLRAVHSEIRAAPCIHGLDALSDQERRVVTALRAVVAGAAIGGGSGAGRSGGSQQQQGGGAGAGAGGGS